MTTLASFLLAITGSLAARVLTSLGIGIFSYAAINTLISTVTSAITANYNGMGIFPLAIINLAGGSHVLAIISAAMVVRGTLMAVKSMRPM